MKRLLSLLSLASSESSKSASRTHRRKARRPLLELLEDRTVPTAVVPPSGIVSWWTGDNTAADLVGPNNGTLNNGAGYAPGNVAGAFNFDGVDDYVQAPGTGLPAGNANRTLELWVKADSFSPTSESFFAGYGNFGTSSQTYHLGTSGSTLFWSQWGTGITGPTLSPGQWYHVAVTNVGNAATLYVNGAAVGSNAVTISTPANSPFYIGRIPGTLGDTRKLDGEVDEVTVYNRALSAAEIQSIYLAGIDGKIKSPNYIATDNPSVAEGAAGSTSQVTFTITRGGNLSGQVAVNWSTADGTAAAGEDYVAASGQVVFQDGELQKTVSVSVIGDDRFEPDETIRLVLSTTADYTAVSGQATILNDDTSVSIGNASALEGVNSLHVLDRFVPDNSGGLSRARTARIGPDGNLYVASADTQSVLRYDGTTGAFLDVVVPPGSGGLIGPNDLAFGPDGSLYVSGSGSGQVLRYDRVSGAFLGVVASGLSAPQGITFGPDGALYIVNQTSNDVLRYKDLTLTTFVAAGSGGLSQPRRAVFGPDGYLYVASSATGQVLRYNGQNGLFVNVFATLTNVLTTAGWLEIGTDGYLYVSGGTPDGSGNKTIVRLNANTGALVDTFNLGRDGWSFTLGPGNIVYSSANSAGGFVDRLGPSSLAAIPVSLSFASAVTVTVNYATANGTALAGSDYTAASGTLTFAPGQTTRTILVSTLDDTAAEATETFTITLSAPVNTTIVGGTGAGTIIDNDTTKFYVVDDGSTDQTYRYGAQGNAVGNSTLTGGITAPRGAAANAAGTTLWVADAGGTVYVYSAAGAPLGSWAAGGLPAKAQVEGLATNGTDIWLVDNKQGKVFKYTGAASRTQGSQSAASSFSLASGNGNPKGIVTDGTSLWVVNDNNNDKVFKYTLSGAPLGNWVIDAANASPTGLTINPNNVSDIWVVDGGTKKVYQYTAAASRTSGSQNATASFALAAGNTNPQDIADPPPPDMLLTPPAASSVRPAASTSVPTVASCDAVFALLAREPLATPRGVSALRPNSPTTDADCTLRPAGAYDGQEPLDSRTSLTSGGSLRPERSAVDPLDGTLVNEDGGALEATGPFSDRPRHDR
jgi:Concanavalin A-like lectin/glucanases superfamily/Calx-beta domain